jgi:hypothetical protein
MARRDGAGIRLITRHGNDFTSRFPIIVAAVMALPARSLLIDGEAIVTNGGGLAVFDLIRHKRHGEAAVLCAFDLIELDDEDLRRSSIEYRKRKLVCSPQLGIVLNEHYENDGEIIFKLLKRQKRTVKGGTRCFVVGRLLLYFYQSRRVKNGSVTFARAT